MSAPTRITIQRNEPIERTLGKVKSHLAVLGADHLLSTDFKTLTARGAVEIVARWFTTDGSLDRFIIEVRRRQTELGLGSTVWTPGACNHTPATTGRNTTQARQSSRDAGND